MIDMTADAVKRLGHEARALDLIGQADGLLDEAYNETTSADHEPHSGLAHYVSSSSDLLELTRERIYERAKNHAQMIGWQVATWEIVPLAREPKNIEPIIWLTGNRMVPSLRNLDAMEAVFQADREGDLWEVAYETLERRVSELNVYMAEPEYDNALYVVDLERWEHIDEEDQTGDSLEGEWRRRDPARYDVWDCDSRIQVLGEQPWAMVVDVVAPQDPDALRTRVDASSLSLDHAGFTIRRV